MGKRLYLILFALTVVVYALGAYLIHIYDVDASQYASISMEMFQTESYLQVFHRGRDYLDKPPLVFWTSAISYLIFGISHWAYRLPSIISSLIGIYSTFRLGRKLYNDEIGKLSALILATCHLYFLHNHDVRTDTLLTNFVIFGTWQIVEYLDSKKWFNLVLAFSGFGLAMLAKGPIGLMVPVLSLGSHFLYKRDFKSIFNPAWIIGILVSVLFLVPMTYGLYQQFDLHPEKTVNGLKNVSGVTFYFWTQSFGRLTGENVWKNDAGYDFFLHTFLWEFMPWMIIAYFSVFRKVYILFKTKFAKDGLSEIITLAGFVLAFIALSKSHYKLPHYIMVIFPHAAILTAHQISEIVHEKTSWFKGFNILQIVIVSLIVVLQGILNFWFFPMPWWVLMLSALGYAMAYYFMKNESKLIRIVVPSAIAIITFNFQMNTNFYPSLNVYHTGSTAAIYIREELKLPPEKVALLNADHHSFDVYSHRLVPMYNVLNIENHLAGKGQFYLYTNEEGKDYLLKNKKGKVLKDFQNFHVLMLRPNFLNPKTRKEACKPYYLVEAYF